MVCSLSLDLFIFCFPSWCFLDETCIFRTLYFVDRICLQALQNGFPSLTMKFSSGNCCTRSCNCTFTVLLFPRRLYLPEVECSDRSLAIDDGLVYLASLWPMPSWLSKRKSYPLTTHTFFSVGVSLSCNGNRHPTHTSNTTQVAQRTNTRNRTIKIVKL